MQLYSHEPSNCDRSREQAAHSPRMIIQYQLCLPKLGKGECIHLFFENHPKAQMHTGTSQAVASRLAKGLGGIDFIFHALRRFASEK